VIPADVTWIRRLRTRSAVDGEQQFFRDVIGETFDRVRYTSAYRSCLINDSKHYWRANRMVSLDISGTSPTFNWGLCLYNVTELDLEGVLVHDVTKEHGFYLHSCFGPNTLRRVIARNCGSQAAQFTARALHHGAMECANAADYATAGDLVLEDWRVENCGLPSGRRAGFALSFFAAQSEPPVPVPELAQRVVCSRVEIVHQHGFGAFLAQGRELLVRGLMVDYDSTDGHPIVQLEKCKSIDVDGDGGSLRGGVVKIIEPPTGKTNFRNFTGTAQLVVVDASGKKIHQDLASHGYQA
jgi:hypothetical protein